MRAFGKNVNEAKTWPEFEKVVKAALGPAGSWSSCASTMDT